MLSETNLIIGTLGFATFVFLGISIIYETLINTMRKYLEHTDQVRDFRRWKIERKEKLEKWN